MIGLGSVDLEDVTVRYEDSLVDTTLLVREVHLAPVCQWEPHRPAAFRAVLELDGETWTLEGEVKPFAAVPTVDVKIDVRGRVQRRHPRLLARLGVCNPEVDVAGGAVPRVEVSL